ncbi:DUF1559 domain-containing protein [Isosphaeraceae bacterium EP7]
MRRPGPGVGRGFTMIELLTVIAITMVLFALLVPAVQSAREAARRIHCVNNLAQLALALQHYQSEHQVFPSGVVDGAGPIANRPPGYHMGWIVQILPEIEQGPAYHHLNFQHGVYAAANSTIAGVRIATLSCPSDPYRPIFEPDEPGAPIAVEHEQSNFAGCHNDRESRIRVTDRGMLFLNSSIRPEDVGDGTSQTIMLGEKLRNYGGLGWMSGTRATLRNTGSRPNARSSVGIDQMGQMEADDPLDEPVPDAIIKLPDGTITRRSQIDPVGGFSSSHPGGANTAFADGSVKFLKDTISRPVMWYLGNRDDGELLDSSSY